MKTKLNSKMNNAKVLMSVTTIGLLAAGGVSAQDLNVAQNTNASFGQKIMQSLTEAQKKVLEQARSLFEAGKRDEAKTLLESSGIKAPMGEKRERLGKGGKGGHGDRKAIEEAIIAGNYANFQIVASTSPLKSLDLATFNLLTPQFTAKKNAENQIRSILKSVGIEAGNKPITNR